MKPWELVKKPEAVEAQIPASTDAPAPWKRKVSSPRPAVVPTTTQEQDELALMSDPQAQKDLLMTPVRLGRELAGGVVGAGTKAWSGLTEVAPAFFGNLSATGDVDKALQAGQEAKAPLEARLQAQQEILSAEPSLISRGGEAVVSPLVDWAEKKTGDTGFVRSGLEAVGDIAMLAPTAKLLSAGAKKGVTRVVEGPSKETLVSKATKEVKPLDAKIDQTLMSITKPTNKKVSGSASRQQYTENGYVATRNILDEIDNGSIEFLDKDGYLVEGRAPQSVGEFAEANQAMLTKLGEEIGAMTDVEGMIDISPVADALKPLTQNRAWQTAAPDAVRQTVKAMDDFSMSGAMTPAELQETISLYNAIKYGKTVDPMTPNAPLVASRIVEELNKIQRDFFEGLGEDLSGVKRQYRAHKAIQEGLDKRYNAIMSQHTHTPLSMWEGGAAHQLVSGKFLSSAILKGVDAWNRFSRNPNTSVKRLFRLSEKRRAIEKAAPEVRRGDAPKGDN